MLKVKDNFSVSIQTPDGAFHYLPNSELAHVDLYSHSLMPSGSTLSGTEVEDLISYLLQTGDESSKHSSTHSAKSDDDDDN
jgi:hypothetical protein